MPGKGGRDCPDCVPDTRIERLRSRMPERYRNVTLETLESRPDLHPKQLKVIEFMRENPFVNYYLCGKNDTGKTHFLYALYDNALRAGRLVVISTLYELVEAAKKEFNTGERNPYLARLENGRYSVFIDDIDKARPTEFVAELFFDYVDRIYRDKHQLAVTSQLEPEQLIEHFEKADPRYGVGITRRIVNDETAIWRMF